MKKRLYISFLLLFVSNAHAQILTCKNISNAIIALPALDVRPYCETAEVRCHALDKFEHSKIDALLVERIGPKLRAQVEYELEVCEMAIRAVDPNYLKPRNQSDH